MSRLPTLKPDEVIRKLRKAGFQVDHVTGSHYVMCHPDGRRVVVPSHRGRDIKRGVLRVIIRQAGLTAEEFLSRAVREVENAMGSRKSTPAQTRFFKLPGRWAVGRSAGGASLLIFRTPAVMLVSPCPDAASHGGVIPSQHRQSWRCHP